MTESGEQRGGGGAAGGCESLAALTRRLVRRSLLNIALTEAARAAALSLGALICVLVAGAPVLDGPWVPAILGAAAVLGAVGLARHRPRPYSVLQEVDRRLGLKDTLSTAFYFRWMAGDALESTAAHRRLFTQAEELACKVEPVRAVPIRPPRRLWVLACLLAMAGGLFGLRFGAKGRLDLRPPLVGALSPRQAEQGAGEPRVSGDPISQGVRRLLSQVGLIAEPGVESLRAGNQAWSAESGRLGDAAAAPPRPALSRPVPAAASEESLEAGGDEGDGAGISTGQQGAQSGESANAQQPWADSNSDLLEKFREALASLLSQLKPRSSSGDGMQVESRGDASESGHSGRASEKGSPGPGRQARGEGNPEAEGAQESGETESAQGASGKSGDREADVQAAREGRSGIGREDGRKDTREAEQLAAMGKLSELIGRRQANLTGEVTIEVASGSQKLRTPYSEREARHAEAGGIVHRDEVPLVFRDYVQRYLELVRKAPASTASSGAPERQP